MQAEVSMYKLNLLTTYGEGPSSSRQGIEFYA